MSSDSKSGSGAGAYTSAFDELLERNRQEFDALYAKSGAAPIERLLEARTPSVTVTSLSKPASSPPLPASRPTRDSGQMLRDSATARSLRTRFGEDWTFDVTERQRDGDQIIVLGKLTVRRKEVGKDIVKAQFGHAPMNGSGASASTEERAYVEASEAALARCAALL